MNTNRLFERQQAAQLLAWQCALRVSGLLNIAALSSVRKGLDTYLLCLQRGAESAKTIQPDDSAKQWMVVCVDTASECVEKSWQDFRNHLQILLLTQDEAVIWMTRIERTLVDDRPAV
ncbi:MAG: hypothetical protein QG599_1803 [Pseudomonadota bacterium]|nr:hypothetical protein [Pseudomonadota bacterium]